MVRKLTTLLMAMVIAVAALPVLAAFAANGSATLNSASNLFAAAGATPFQITVTNTEQATGGVLGVGQDAAARVNYIDVLLPSNLTGVKCALTAAVAANWNCNDNNFPGAQQYVRLSAKQAGQGLAGGASIPVNFTAAVAQPAGVSRTDSFVVRTATDTSDYKQTTGNLAQTVRGLKLGDNVTLNDLGRVGPFSATEFTSGQTFEASYTVTNTSSVSISVTPSLATGGLAATLKNVTSPFPLAPGATQTVTYTVNTAVQNPANQTVYDLQGSATGTSTVQAVNTAQNGPAVRIINGNVDTLTTKASVTVDAPARIRFASGARDTVLVGNNDSRTNLVSAGPTTIKISAIKSQIPKVVLDAFNSNPAAPTGSYIKVTVANCPAGVTCPAVYGSLSTVDGGARELPRTNGNDRNVTLQYSIDFTPLAGIAVGNLLDLNAQFLFAGNDDNKLGFAADLDIGNLLQIDAAAPVLLLAAPNAPSYNGVCDTDPATRDCARVKDGDVVNIAGSVRHTGDLSSLEVRLSSNQAPSDGSANYNQVVVTQADLGSATANGDGTFTQTFSKNITLPGNANNTGGEGSYVLGSGNFAALLLQGVATDRAGNQGLGAPADLTNPRLTLDLDNDHPDITPTAPFTVSGQTQVKALGYYIQNDAYGANSVLRVTWNPGLYNDAVVGGCLTNMWQVDGVNVTSVRYYDGSVCQEGAKPPTFDATTAPLGSNVNDRILVLDGPITPATQTVNFSYRPNGGDLGGVLGTSPTTDDVRNRAYAQSGVVIDGRTPQLPNIVSNLVTRASRDSFDAAAEGPEPVGASTDTDPAGTDFQLLHANIADLDIPVTNFIGGVDDLQIVEILNPADFAGSFDPPTSSYRVISRSQSANDQSQFDLTELDIEYSGCGDNCQTRYQRAFRFIRRATTVGGTTYDINGPFLRVDFLYDTQRLLARGSALTIGTSADGDDLVTIDFGGDGNGVHANSGNTIASFYSSQTEWNPQRSLGGPGNTDYATHQAQSVVQQGNKVQVEIDYGTQDPSSFYATDYFKFDANRKIEDLAGNVVTPYYRLFPNGTVQEFTF